MVHLCFAQGDINKGVKKICILFITLIITTSSWSSQIRKLMQFSLCLFLGCKDPRMMQFSKTYALQQNICTLILKCEPYLLQKQGYIKFKSGNLTRQTRTLPNGSWSQMGRVWWGLNQQNQYPSWAFGRFTSDWKITLNLHISLCFLVDSLRLGRFGFRLGLVQFKWYFLPPKPDPRLIVLGLCSNILGSSRFDFTDFDSNACST